MQDTISNIRVLRSGKDEVSTAVDFGYREVLVRKGPDAIDSTIALSVNEALELIVDLQSQCEAIRKHEQRKPLTRGRYPSYDTRRNG
jgi:hypothetical protein